MEESGHYNESDLAPFHRRLGELRAIVQHDAESGKHPEAMTKLLERQLNECGAPLSFLASLDCTIYAKPCDFHRCYRAVSARLPL